MDSVIGWLCRSPRRLVAVAGGVLVVLVAGNYLVSRGDEPSRTSQVAGPDPSISFKAPDPAPFVRAAVRFTGLWASVGPHRTAQQWRSDLLPLACEELARGLKLTDPATLPDAKVRGIPQVRSVTDESALVAVELSNDQRVLVTVVRSGDDLSVCDIQPFAGN